MMARGPAVEENKGESNGCMPIGFLEMYNPPRNPYQMYSVPNTKRRGVRS